MIRDFWIQKKTSVKIQGYKKESDFASRRFEGLVTVTLREVNASEGFNTCYFKLVTNLNSRRLSNNHVITIFGESTRIDKSTESFGEFEFGKSSDKSTTKSLRRVAIRQETSFGELISKHLFSKTLIRVLFQRFLNFK